MERGDPQRQFNISREMLIKLLENLHAANRAHERFNPGEDFTNALVKNMKFPGAEMFAARLAKLFEDRQTAE